jgi:hypothetical protein
MDAGDPEIKAYCERMESVWRHAANQYDFIDAAPGKSCQDLSGRCAELSGACGQDVCRSATTLGLLPPRGTLE